MRVYTFYDSSPAAHPEQSEFIRLWALSWERRGFTPKLLTVRHAARSKFYTEFVDSVGEDSSILSDYRRLQWFALQAVHGCGWLVSPRVMNFSLAPRRSPTPKKTMDVNAFSWPAFRVSGSGATRTLAQMLHTNKWVAATESFPEGLKEFDRAADVLTCGRAL